PKNDWSVSKKKFLHVDILAVPVSKIQDTSGNGGDDDTKNKGVLQDGVVSVWF
ncbi:MAG: hypothetical protein UW42_C0038G0001, partial [Candidatus Collierbacteria bacterium GW2011_GWB1_44_197]